MLACSSVIGVRVEPGPRTAAVPGRQVAGDQRSSAPASCEASSVTSEPSRFW
jgi:hypothetical protein